MLPDGGGAGPHIDQRGERHRGVQGEAAQFVRHDKGKRCSHTTGKVQMGVLLCEMEKGAVPEVVEQGVEVDLWRVRDGGAWVGPADVRVGGGGESGRSSPTGCSENKWCLSRGRVRDRVCNRADAAGSASNQTSALKGGRGTGLAKESRSSSNG